MASVTKWVMFLNLGSVLDVDNLDKWRLVGGAYEDDVLHFRKESCFPSEQHALNWMNRTFPDAMYLLFPVTWEE